MSEAGQEKAAAPKADKKAGGSKRVEKSAGTQVAVGEQATDANYVPRFKKRYAEVVKPELTKKFVLVLFPPVPEGAYCVYFEFSDEPDVFARFCFDKEDGEMVDKRKHSVLHPPVGGQGTVV